MEKYKVEIVDNQITNGFESHLYKWEKVNKWYQFERFDWKCYARHYLGKRYMCPEIFQGKITIEQYFERDNNRLFKDYNIVEVHRTLVTKS